MKVYSITGGELSHASTSIAQNRDFSNRQLNRDGTADPRSREASHARGVETGHQTLGRANALVPALWGKAAQTGGNRAPEHSNNVRTCAGATTTLSLPRVSASVVSSQPLVRPAQGRNHQYAPARSRHVSRVLVALSPTNCATRLERVAEE